MSLAIRVENLSKRYRLGVINRHMLYEDLQSRWARWRGKPDPNSPVLESKRRSDGESHEEFWALRDVSFDVGEGESIGIIGSNGAGKSTLLKILSKITAPTSGRVLMRGRVASLLEVGTGFHQELTGRENVFLNGAILGMTRSETARKFDQIVEFSGVKQFIDTPVKRYSSGMRVRLAFAVAAYLEPEILIVDEVLAVGDVAFQEKCINQMEASCRSGRTILFVSHNMAAIEALCSRGIFLDGGRVIIDGTEAEAIAKYLETASVADRQLSDRSDRIGSGDLTVTAIEFRDRGGKPLALLSSGLDFDVHLRFQKHADKKLSRPRVGIIVKDTCDTRIFAHYNELSGDHFDALPETGSFVCSIDSLPLPASSYRLGFVVSDVSATVLDGISHALDFTVGVGNFFGTGRTLDKHKGLCLVKARWRLQS